MMFLEDGTKRLDEYLVFVSGGCRYLTGFLLECFFGFPGKSILVEVSGKEVRTDGWKCIHGLFDMFLEIWTDEKRTGIFSSSLNYVSSRPSQVVLTMSHIQIR